MSESGIAEKLLDFVDIFIGRVKGGLGIVAAVSLCDYRGDFRQRVYRRGFNRPGDDSAYGGPGVSARVCYRPW